MCHASGVWLFDQNPSECYKRVILTRYLQEYTKAMLVNIAAFVVVVAGIMSAKTLILPFLLAAFLAIICGPPLYWLRTRGIPPFFSIVILVLVLLSLKWSLPG